MGDSRLVGARFKRSLALGILLVSEPSEPCGLVWLTENICEFLFVLIVVFGPHTAKIISVGVRVGIRRLGQAGQVFQLGDVIGMVGSRSVGNQIVGHSIAHTLGLVETLD